MIYQLPNGKIINITIEQYLELSDEDIQYLVSIDYGNFARSPWAESAISKTGKKDQHKPEDTEHDTSIDYTAEEEDCHQKGNFILEDSDIEDFPDIPDIESD